MKAGKIKRLDQAKSLAIAALLAVGIVETAHGSSSTVTFGGVVTKANPESQIQDSPNVIVSFGSHVLLPLSQRQSPDQTVRVFDEDGIEVRGPRFSYLDNNGVRVPVQKILLDEDRNQAFVVCPNHTSGCVRYQVTRY